MSLGHQQFRRKAALRRALASPPPAAWLASGEMPAGSFLESPAGRDDRSEALRRALRAASVPDVCGGDGRAPGWWRSVAPRLRSFHPAETVAAPDRSRQSVSTVRSSAMPGSRTMRTIQRVNVALELPDQRLESIDLAKRKSPEQIHELLYCLLRGRNDSVTSFLTLPQEGGRPRRVKAPVRRKRTYRWDVAPCLLMYRIGSG